jgi:hypothetical protein
MRSVFDFVSWAEGVLERAAREHAFAEKMAVYAAVMRMIDQTLGDALAAGDEDLVTAIKAERARFQRDHFPALLDRAKELSR